MKQLSLILVFVFSILLAQAQMPKAINYQAVARNSSGQAIANQAIKVRLSIVNSAAGNAVIYSETRSVTTNSLGLFNLQIGSAGAVATTGSFTAINWLNNTTTVENLKVELDINNNNSFVDMGVQALVTVPYAFAADQAVNAINIGGHYVDTNTPNTGDILRWNGSAWVATDPVAAAAKRFVGFRAQLTNSILVTGAYNYIPVKFNNDATYSCFDSANVYNPATGVFTAPSSGMYFLNTTMNFYTLGSNYTSNGMMFFYSGSRGILGASGESARIEIVAGKLDSRSLSAIVYLQANEQVTVQLDGINPSVNYPLQLHNECTFQAYKIN
ncbi:C1q-like domain-containing protein [Pseudobacter ginsenosidimutans]|uniref:C1q domain-containing protein n=1 Tax=Pseudobacter ginsenosidimutans TaxID=661488 RepID=A0A4Q7N6A0_9BACT|nr:hypothetical protein [Pseudobacter ginsenosidimutans]QEC45120.1 hypothetical protein FSB84_26800 [Pseudobacter ginsenosidimutans]RZS76616.1 C1q domain-containing protein [Pseudobacter ginsenosidimutans]